MGGLAALCLRSRKTHQDESFATTPYAAGLSILQQTDMPGNEYVVLVTDGEPTYGQGCVGAGSDSREDVAPEYIDDRLALTEGAWTISPPDMPIGTFVVKVPDSDPYPEVGGTGPWLSEAVRLGGSGPDKCPATPELELCEFEITSSSEQLLTAITPILGQVVACEFYPPADPRGQTLDLDNVAMEYIDDPGGHALFVSKPTAPECQDGTQGWCWNAQQTALVLCPATCGMLRMSPLASVRIRFGCN